MQHFTIARTQKQSRCPLTDVPKKMCVSHTMEYYLVIKRNEFESVVVRWMNLELVLQSEVSQKGKNKYCILKHIYGL